MYRSTWINIKKYLIQFHGVVVVTVYIYLNGMFTDLLIFSVMHLFQCYVYDARDFMLNV
jgi:hypothetical protein